MKNKRFASQGSDFGKQVKNESFESMARKDSLAETKKKFLEDAARAKLFSKKNSFQLRNRAVGKQDFTFNTLNLQDTSQIKRAPSPLKKVYNEMKYLNDEKQFLTEGKDYRDYMRNTIKEFNKTLYTRSESFNITLPSQIK